MPFVLSVYCAFSPHVCLLCIALCKTNQSLKLESLRNTNKHGIRYQLSVKEICLTLIASNTGTL